jgi:hypothetical protein
LAFNGSTQFVTELADAGDYGDIGGGCGADSIPIHTIRTARSVTCACVLGRRLVPVFMPVLAFVHYRLTFFAVVAVALLGFRLIVI